MLNSGFVLFIIAPISFLLLFFTLWYQKAKLQKYFFSCLFLAYLLGVINVTLFPLPIDAVDIAFGREMQNLHNNWVPFATIIDAWDYGYFPIFLKQIGGNILLTVPFGFLVPLIWNMNDSFKKMFLLGLLFTIGIESAQFLISAMYGYTYKITDVDDIILNTLGCMIGYLCFRAAKPILRFAFPRLAFS